MLDLICCFISGFSFGMAVMIFYFYGCTKYLENLCHKQAQELFNLQYRFAHMKHNYIRRRDPKTGRFIKERND